MEGRFDDDELNRILAETQPTDQIEEHLLRTQDRLQDFLQSRGVEFDHPEVGAPEELIAERYGNRLQLRALAATVAMIEAIDEAKKAAKTTDPDYKKRLQTQYLVLGYGGPWVALIDREIPGEPLTQPLTDSDMALISDVALETITKGEEAKAWHNSRIAQMKNFLEQEGVTELGLDEEIALAQLTVLSYSPPGWEGPLRRVEDARNILFKNNLSNETWNKLIEVFFTQL